MQNADINILVNGKKEQVEAKMSIRALLVKKGINPHVVACELNLKIIKRDDLANTELKESDVLEIIQMIGGG